MARQPFPLPAIARLATVGTGALALVAGALSAPTLAAGATPQGPPDPQQHGHHGKVVYPTRGSHAASTAAQGSGPLSYGGGVHNVGVTTGPPKVYLVFWGSQWGAVSTGSDGYTRLAGDPQAEAPRLQAMFKGLGTNGETWSGVMTQYCEGVAAGATSCPTTAAHVGHPSGDALAGVWADESVAAPGQATGHQLAAEAVSAAGHFGNTTAAANRNAQYVILSPTGTHPDGFNTATGQFCAYHDYNGDTTLSGGAAASGYGDVAFTNMPYVTDMGTSCGRNYVNAGTAGNLDGVTLVEGHEYAETITDQNPPGGWTDSTGYENADKCAWVGVGGTGGAQNITFTTGSFAMQATWANDGNNCEIQHAYVGGGSTANTVTLTNPGNQTGTVSQSASLQIRASDSGGAALTYSATGLPAGLSINSSTGLVSGTLTTAGTYTVTVTARDSTGASGSTAFTWTVSSSSPTGCPSPGQKLGNPGFETGTAAPWTATAGVIDNSSGEPAHSGAWKAWLDGYGTTHSDTLAQTVSIPSGCSSYTLSFWLHIDTAESTTTVAYDKLSVQIGSTTLATYSNLNRNSGYVQKSFNVSAYAGQTVTVKFAGTEDSSLQTSFVLDDTALTVS